MYLYYYQYKIMGDYIEILDRETHWILYKIINKREILFLDN